MSLLDALARRSAVASYSRFCRIEGGLDTVKEELEALWKQVRPAAFAAADDTKGKFQFEYKCELECGDDLSDKDIENALPEELAAVRRLNGGRLIVIRKFTHGSTFLINLHFSVERDRSLEELKAKHAERRQREDVKPEVKKEKKGGAEVKAEDKPHKKQKVKREQ